MTTKTSNTTEKGIELDIIGLDDPFGSLITNIPGEEFTKLGYTLGEKLTVFIDKKPVTLPYVKTFHDVAIGELLLYIDSRGRVGIADNEGNYAKTYNYTPPGNIFIPRKVAQPK